MKPLIKISRNTFVFLISVYFVFFLNIPFWCTVLKSTHFNNISDLVYIAAASINLTAAFGVIFSLILYPYLQKPLILILATITIFATYSMYYFNIEINLEMIQNVLQTDTQESMDLITPKLLLWLVLLGAPPVLMLFTIIIDEPSVGGQVKSRLKYMGICLGLMLITTGIAYQNIVVIHRNNRRLAAMIAPMNWLYYLGKSFKRNSPKQELVKIGLDATKGPHWQNAPKKTVVVIVVGEAARSGNFSLNDYPRETNPLLKTKNVISLKDVTACATSTAPAVPGIFSRLQRTDYSPEKAIGEENLLDILHRVGFSIRWRDNNSSSKNVAFRFNEENIRELNQNDEALLEGLDQHIHDLKTDGVIVLHQLGSHGPAYYKRYPAQFDQFKPGCNTNEIQGCKVEDLVNTYDNTILYTDFILTKIIELLEKNDHLNTAMVYISDHGESLGEYGIYLHGAPYLIAPREQIHIPWIIWLSEDFKQQFKIDAQSLQARANEKYSHDNFFHSILGMLDIRTKEYDPKLDIFKK